MVMQRMNNLRVVAPSMLCDGTSNIIVREKDNMINFLIEPEKNSSSTIYFSIPENITDKKFTININFNYENASVDIFGLYQIKNKQSVEIKTEINHFVPHCNSKQIWRGVLHDFAKANFEGKIIVAKDAQKTDAQLSNKNLLLSKSAEINTKPILEIYADDVKCSHGATVGFLDNEALFYLRSRGISENTAHEILVQGFINEVIHVI